MARILTQEEIDALLSTVVAAEQEPSETAEAAAGLPDRRASVYDFKHPNRVSKDQIRKLENIHDKFGGHLASALSTIQRAIVDVDLVSVDQITYTEYIAGLVAPSCTYTFRLPPLEGLCILDFDTSLAFAIVDRLFGGRGTAYEAERELTGIERNVMRKIIGRVFEQLEQGWERVVAAKAEQVGFETNPHFLQVVPPGETVIVVAMQLNMPSASGQITICYPYVALEKVLERLSTQSWTDAVRVTAPSDERVQIARMIRGVTAEVSAVLANTELSVRDLLSLEPGTVIPLPIQIGDPVTVRIGGKDKYLGTAGNVRRRRAVKIEATITDED